MVAIAQPPPEFPVAPVFSELPAGSEIYRIYDPTTRHRIQALTFRYFGPISRFDHQRWPLDRPDIDPDRGIYYAAPTFSCCVVELFGSTQGRLIEIHQQELALATLARPLILLDLQGKGAMKAGLPVAAVVTADRDKSQAWSRYFYEAYPDIDGIIYGSAHNSEPTIALYERAKDSLVCQESIPLTDPTLRAGIVEIALENGLRFGI